MKYNVAILNGKIISHETILEGSIGIVSDKIVSILKGSLGVQAERVINADGLLVLPGVIDVHYHCRDPGYTHREDFSTGTMAALSGGTTTILEMPVSLPPVYNKEIFVKRREIASTKSYTDFGLYGGCGTLNKEDILGQKEAGAIGFKMFLHEPPPEKKDSMKGLYISNDLELLEVLQIMNRINLPLAIHAEENSILKFYRREIGDRKDPLAFYDANPVIAEELAILKLVLLISRMFRNVKTYFVHISSKESVKIIREAKKKGLNIACETCPHYLLFSKDKLEIFGPYAKVSPPLRTEEDRKALWNAINSGVIDCVSSDHAPYTKEEKEVGLENIWLAPAGLPGGELLLPIMISHALKGFIKLSKVVEVLCKNPATFFGIYPKKGVIQIGSDADIVLIDPKVEWTVKCSNMLTKSKESALIYEGLKLKGKIMKVLLRGIEVYSDSEGVIGRPGYGRFISPLSSGRNIRIEQFSIS
ncbi:MAG: dihydroorotase [Saccharolobus sp.]|uniref:dihydroorotase n=1 Tax=Saccharolobus sp. TaxID=2100761 RepID=UPI003170D003